MGGIKHLKVAIDVSIRPGGLAGGVEQWLLALVNSLGKLDDGDEEYIIVVHQNHEDWLRAYIGPNEHIVPVPRLRLSWKQVAKSSIRKVVPDFMSPSLLAGLRYFQRNKPNFKFNSQAKLDDFFKSLDIDVVHFPFQTCKRVYNIPSIYNPHDLGHLHYPDFFTQETIDRRETLWPACCHQAQAVAVESQWIKDDIAQRYNLKPDKIYVIPMAAPTDSYESVSSETLTQVRNKFLIPDNFVFYPAQTLPHKNHIRLLKAIALLRDRNQITINLVCTGRKIKNDNWSNIARIINELDLENQVQFLGFVSSTELRALYRMAQFVSIPTLFEAASFPMYEAFLEEVPVICSRVTALPEQAGDAALLFDPMSVEDIARAMYQMATDEWLRKTLCRRGKERICVFTWERTAKAYRALYRKIVGYALSNEDKLLLSTDWMRIPMEE